MLFVIFPGSYVDLTVLFLFVVTLTVLLTIRPHTNVDVATGPFLLTMPMFETVKPLSFILGTICVFVGSKAVLFPMQVHAGVGGTLWVSGVIDIGAEAVFLIVGPHSFIC